MVKEWLVTGMLKETHGPGTVAERIIKELGESVIVKI